MRPLLSAVFCWVLSCVPSTGEEYNCFFVQRCDDIGSGCGLAARRMHFDTSKADYATSVAGKIDLLFIYDDGVSALLTIFPEDDVNPPDQSKLSIHSRRGGPSTLITKIFHGSCSSRM